MNGMRRIDKIFVVFSVALFATMLLFGLGATIVVLYGDHSLALRMLNIFAAMFTGLLGFGSGYILGNAAGGSRENGNGSRAYSADRPPGFEAEPKSPDVASSTTGQRKSRRRRPKATKLEKE